MKTTSAGKWVGMEEAAGIPALSLPQRRDSVEGACGISGNRLFWRRMFTLTDMV